MTIKKDAPQCVSFIRVIRAIRVICGEFRGVISDNL